jgi:hypothetical protein
MFFFFSLPPDKLGQENFPPDPFKFIIQQSFFYLTMYSIATQCRKGSHTEMKKSFLVKGVRFATISVVTD